MTIAKLQLDLLDTNVDVTDYHVKLNANFQLIASKVMEMVQLQTTMLTTIRTWLKSGDPLAAARNMPTVAQIDSLERLQEKLELYKELCPTQIENAVVNANTPTNANPFKLHGTEFANDAVKFLSGVVWTGWDISANNGTWNTYIPVPIDPDLYDVYIHVTWREIVETAVGGGGVTGDTQYETTSVPGSIMYRVAPAAGEPAKTAFNFIQTISDGNLGINSIQWLAIGVRKAALWD